MNNELSSSLTFITGSAMSGQSISCIGDGGFNSSGIVRVRTDGFPPILSKIDIVDIIIKNTIATFAVEWSTYNRMGDFLIQVIPFPVSLSSSSLLISFINITLLYDIYYILTIKATNSAGTSKTQLNLMRGNCSVPTLATDVILFPFHDTTEGATLVFACGPQTETRCIRTDQSMSWIPNPAAHQCIVVVCGPPPSPLNGFVDANASHRYVEGDTVSFQCLSDPSSTDFMTATCSKSNGNVGTWKPNPLLKCYNQVKNRCSGQDKSAISGGTSFLAGTVFGAAIGAGIVLTYFCMVKRVKVQHPPSPSSGPQLAHLTDTNSAPPVIDPLPKSTPRLSNDPPAIRSILKKTHQDQDHPRIAGTRNNQQAPSVTIRES